MEKVYDIFVTSFTTKEEFMVIDELMTRFYGTFRVVRKDKEEKLKRWKVYVSNQEHLDLFWVCWEQMQMERGLYHAEYKRPRMKNKLTEKQT